MEELPPVYEELMVAIRGIPGVTQATAITRLPFPGLTNTNTLHFLGRDGGDVPEGGPGGGIAGRRPSSREFNNSFEAMRC